MIAKIARTLFFVVALLLLAAVVVTLAFGNLQQLPTETDQTQFLLAISASALCFIASQRDGHV